VILSDPYVGKALKEGLRRFLMGRLRIVYRVEGEEIQIIAIGPRRRIYEEIARAVRSRTQDPG
jgi:mRNA-degrading endonuclease RelE of RelBE toxin-antitoxin system